MAPDFLKEALVAWWRNMIGKYHFNELPDDFVLTISLDDRRITKTAGELRAILKEMEDRDGAQDSTHR